MSFRLIAGSDEALLGFPSHQWLRPGFWPARIHARDREAVLACCARAAEVKGGHELEYRIVDAMGEPRWLHQVITFAEDGSDLAQGFFIDITRRMDSHADLKGTLQLKDQILRLLSEQMSKPLNELSSYSSMLARHVSARHDDVGSDIALEVRSALEQLELVMVQVRTLAQHENMDVEQVTQALADLRALEQA